MAVNTVVLGIKIDKNKLSLDDVQEKLASVGKVIFGEVDGDPVCVPFGSGVEKLLIFKGLNGSHASMRIYQDGNVTLDVHHHVGSCKDGEEQQFDMVYIRSLDARVLEHFGDDCLETRSLLTPIKRGGKVWPYGITADDRIVEFDFDYVAFEGKSPFQTVQIYHSVSKGNLLLLDGDIMLGESDLIYTQTVCALATEKYAGKEVLILGGGDGGILHELLKLQPKFVLMAEIDEMVIKACRTHMRSVCGDAMDTYTGPNHKIVLRDCVEVLHESISSDRKFDYVINDLTEFPVEKSVRGYGYDFETTSLITELSLKAIKDNGKVLARGNCVSAVEYQDKFEGDLKTMGADFIRKDVFVPSFGEIYSLYEIWKRPQSASSVH